MVVAARGHDVRPSIVLSQVRRHVDFPAHEPKDRRAHDQLALVLAARRYGADNVLLRLVNLEERFVQQRRTRVLRRRRGRDRRGRHDATAGEDREARLERVSKDDAEERDEGTRDAEPARSTRSSSDELPLMKVAAAPRPRRGQSAEVFCGGAAAATWIVRGGLLRRRRGYDVDIPWM